MDKNKKEVLKQALKILMENSNKLIEENCRKCSKRDACFPLGYIFKIEEIEECEKIPESVKVFWRAKQLGIIAVEYPFEVDLR